MTLPLHQPNETTIHQHTWHRVPAHIATIAFEYPNEKSYNAACECGATEWVHWTPIKEET